MPVSFACLPTENHFEAIAVHPDLTYVVLRRTSAEAPLLIVAKERMDALADIIGTADIVAELLGRRIP